MDINMQMYTILPTTITITRTFKVWARINPTNYKRNNGGKSYNLVCYYDEIKSNKIYYT